MLKPRNMVVKVKSIDSRKVILDVASKICHQYDPR